MTKYLITSFFSFFLQFAFSQNSNLEISNISLIVEKFDKRFNAVEISFSVKNNSNHWLYFSEKWVKKTVIKENKKLLKEKYKKSYIVADPFISIGAKLDSLMNSLYLQTKTDFAEISNCNSNLITEKNIKEFVLLSNFSGEVHKIDSSGTLVFSDKFLVKKRNSKFSPKYSLTENQVIEISDEENVKMYILKNCY